jgi:1-acyl-sn-glycerol-3-phosphate acyltransferase
VFGQFLIKANMIAIDRTAGAKALLNMTRRARDAVRGGAQLVIFPEGTRTPPGAPPAYKTGIAQIYVTCGVPCLPVALNSGLFWPRRTFMRYPGTLVVEFLDPLPPGLSRDEFLTRIRTGIEEATNHLVEAGQAEQAQLFGRVRRPASSGG